MKQKMVRIQSPPESEREISTESSGADSLSQEGVIFRVASMESDSRKSQNQPKTQSVTG
jgi:hypothetical protein